MIKIIFEKNSRLGEHMVNILLKWYFDFQGTCCFDMFYLFIVWATEIVGTVFRPNSIKGDPTFMFFGR